MLLMHPMCAKALDILPMHPMCANALDMLPMHPMPTHLIYYRLEA